MHTLEEKRVYDDRRGATELFVASATGLVRVRVAGTTVGEFSLADRRAARDVAAVPGGTDPGSDPGEGRNDTGAATSGGLPGGTVAVATEEDVLLGPVEAGNDAGDEAGRGGGDDASFVETGFGPAVAVGVHEGTVVAADEDGRVARYRPALEGEIDAGASGDGATPDEGAWDPIEGLQSSPGESSVSVRAIDGGLVGTDRGVFRLRDDRLVPAGLSDVRDVAAAGPPLAAAVDGVFALGNGWMVELEAAAAEDGLEGTATGSGGPAESGVEDGTDGAATGADDERGFHAIAADPGSDPGRLDRAHAAAGATIYGRVDGEWRRAFDVGEPVAGIAHGETTYAVTRGGTVLAAPLESGEEGGGDGDEEGCGDSDEEGGGDGREEGDAASGSERDAVDRGREWRPTVLGVRDVGGVAIR